MWLMANFLSPKFTIKDLTLQTASLKCTDINVLISTTGKHLNPPGFSKLIYEATRKESLKFLWEYWVLSG